MQSMLISGAGSGIGRAIAVALADAGFQIYLLGRTKASLEATQAKLTSSRDHRTIVADVRNQAELREGLRQLEEEPLHGVIASAGVGGENQYGSDDRWQEILETNLTGSYNIVNEALPYLRRNRGTDDYRSIVLISSILARLGVPGYTAYCASKAGLLGLMRSWSQSLAPERILVNAVCPGWVDTEMARLGLQTFADHQGTSFETVLKEQMSMVPLGKMSAPQEVAALVELLVGGRQTSFTGQTLDMNNGALMP